MSRATREPTTRPAGKSRSVTDLYREFEKAHVAANAVPAPPACQLHNEPFARAMDKCNQIAAEIIWAPAHSAAEMLLKIRIAAWRVEVPDNLEGLDQWKPTVDDDEGFDALVSLRDDLRRLGPFAGECDKVDAPVGNARPPG